MADIVNIKQVARSANVSIGTVSNVFKHPEKVSPKTRDKVIRIANELGFSPNPLASALVTSKTYIIGLMVSYSHLAARGSAINEFTKAAAEYGYIVLLSVTDMDIEKEARAVEWFIKYKVDGVVVYADYAEEKDSHFVKLAKSGIPCVVFKRYNKAYDNIIVSADKAFQDLAEQLRKYRHREIGVIVSGLYQKDGTQSVRVKRIRTFKEKLLQAGIAFCDENVMEIESDSLESGKTAADDWLATRDHLPDVFLCFYERTALGMQNRFLDRGYRIPEDLSIVAYSDAEISQFVKPELTAIVVKETDMLLKALDILLARIENPDAPFRDYEMNHVFEFKESLGSARKKV